MPQNKRRKDRSVARLMVTVFVIAIVAAIAYVIVTQSGIIPGDMPTQQGGVGPGSGG